MVREMTRRQGYMGTSGGGAIRWADDAKRAHSASGAVKIEDAWLRERASDAVAELGYSTRQMGGHLPEYTYGSFLHLPIHLRGHVCRKEDEKEEAFSPC
jgi:hypothetical protein